MNHLLNMIPALVNRQLYPSLAEEVYLNQASIGLIAEPVVKAMHAFLDESARHGNMRLTDEQEVALFGNLRTPAAHLLHCDPEHVAITACASDLLGQLPYWYNLCPEDEVVLVESDFPAISRPWLTSGSGARAAIRWVQDAPGEDLTQTIVDQLSSRTKLVVVGHVQYGTGSLVDVPALGSAASRVGASLIVDATQSAGVLDVNGPEWNADAVISSGYKWLGGHGGVAISYLSDALIEKTPVLAGWMGAPEPFEFDTKNAPFADPASKFTMSTMSYLSIIGLAEALKLGQQTSYHSTTKHIAQLTAYLENALATTGWCSFHQATAPSPIVSLANPEADGSAVYQTLMNNQIHCSQRNGRLRISLAPFVNSSDLDQLVSILSLFD